MTALRLTLVVLPSPRSRSRRPRAVAARTASPTGSVAVVNGTEISKAELDKLVEQAKRGYKRRTRRFRRPGRPSTRASRQQYVAYLVELAEFRKAAEDLGVKVTEKDIDKVENQTIKDQVRRQARRVREGAEEGGLHGRGVPRERARGRRALAQKIFDAVTKDVKVTDQEILDVLHREPVAVRHAGVARRPPHPHRREGQGRERRLRGEQGEGRRGVRAAQGRRRLRDAREGGLR